MGWGGNFASCLGSPQCQVGPDSRTHRQTSEMAFGGGSYLIIFFLIVLTAKGILLVFSVTFRPLKCWGRQQESPPPLFKVAGFSSSGETCPDKATPRAGAATNAAQRRALLPLDLRPPPLLPPHLRCCPLDAAGRGASPIPNPTSSGLILN